MIAVITRTIEQLHQVVREDMIALAIVVVLCTVAILIAVWSRP